MRRSTHSKPALAAFPPPKESAEYSSDLAEVARRIAYRSPVPSKSGLPIYVLSAASFPDAREVDFDQLLPYILARLPGEDELLGGQNYEVIFFAGGEVDGYVSAKKTRPRWGWFLQAYQVFSRALRKRLQRLYLVHETSWVRIIFEAFSTVVSPKSRKKIVYGKSLFS